MAKKDVKTPPQVGLDDIDDIDDIGDIEDIEEVDEVVLDEDIVEVLDDALEVPIEDEFEDTEDEEDDYDDDDDEPDSDEHDDETAEALEELETQELQLLDDEANEAMLVDEVEELRAMRREELTMNVDAQSQKDDEFVCQSCFLVKRTSQLANRRKMICFDCVA
ncbi:MAG TPA: DUF4193 family protein [Acidimicrobiia bacterium]|jgi:hypothetical protein